MIPTMFNIGAFRVSGYIFFNLFGFLTASIFILYMAKKESLDLIELSLYISFLWSFFIIGAGLYYHFKMFFLSPTNYIKNITIYFHPFFHEHSFFSGIVLFSLFAYIYAKKIFKNNYKKILAISFIGMSLYQAIGKLGCFSAGCCFGKPTSFFLGLKFKYLGRKIHPYAGVKIHPTQLYESFFDLLNFLLLFILLKKKVENRKIISLYFINYGLIRFFEEYLRGDLGRGYLVKSSSSLLSLSTPQLYSLIFIVFGTVLYKDFFKFKKTGGN